MAIFGVKDLYVNIPITGIIQIATNMRGMKRIDPQTDRQLILPLDLALNQNNFQFRDSFSKPETG
jgi:hypothetical protein